MVPGIVASSWAVNSAFLLSQSAISPAPTRMALPSANVGVGPDACVLADVAGGAGVSVRDVTGTIAVVVFNSGVGVEIILGE